MMVLFACTKQETNPFTPMLASKWAMSLALTNAANSNGFCGTSTGGKTIEFFNDGKIIANNSLCSISNTNQESEATFDNDFIYPQQCQTEKLEYTIEGQILTITYPCIEGYVEKYTKMDE